MLMVNVGRSNVCVIIMLVVLCLMLVSDLRNV